MMHYKMAMSALAPQDSLDRYGAQMVTVRLRQTILSCLTELEVEPNSSSLVSRAFGGPSNQRI